MIITFAEVFFLKIFAFVKVFHYICSGNYNKLVYNYAALDKER